MEEKIGTYIRALMEAHRMVGAAVGVVKDGKVLLEAGYGVRELHSQKPVTEHSLFHMASISKPFTATAVMQLVEGGKLALEDDIRQHLPELRVENPFGGAITVRQMLSHTSGFPDVMDYEWHRAESEDDALEKYVRELDIRLLFKPGDRVRYSNMAYEVLGHLVHRVSGQLFEDYQKEHVLNPPGMAASTFFAMQVLDEFRNTPHTCDLDLHVSDVYPYNRKHAPSSTLHSSAHEMNRWALAHLAYVSGGRTPILSPELHELMWMPVMSAGRADQPDKCAGLGWFIDQHRGQRIIYHGGHDTGFMSCLILVPEAQIGVTLMTNTEPQEIELMALGILDIAAGLEPEWVKPHILRKLGPAYREHGLPALQEHLVALPEPERESYHFELDGYLSAAYALLDSQHNTSAIELVTFALEQQPEAPEAAEAYEVLARAHYQNDEMAQAAEMAKKSLALKPDNPFLQEQLDALGQDRPA